MRSTKKRCLLLSEMIVRAYHVDRSRINKDEALRVLQSLVSFKRPEQLVLYLNFLKNEGSRAGVDTYITYRRQASSPTPAEITSATPIVVPSRDFHSISLFEKYDQRLNTLYRLLPEQGITFPDTPILIRGGVLAWDMAHLSILSEMAHAYGLITNRQMWDNLILAWRKSVAAFDSWQEFAQSCLLGMVLHEEQIGCEELLKLYQTVTESPESPWVTTSFK